MSSPDFKGLCVYIGSTWLIQGNFLVSDLLISYLYYICTVHLQQFLD